MEYQEAIERIRSKRNEEQRKRSALKERDFSSLRELLAHYFEEKLCADWEATFGATDYDGVSPYDKSGEEVADELIELLERDDFDEFWTQNVPWYAVETLVDCLNDEGYTVRAGQHQERPKYPRPLFFHWSSRAEKD